LIGIILLLNLDEDVDMINP